MRPVLAIKDAISLLGLTSVRGLALGFATDLYSAAIISIELLTGRKPFPQKGHEAVFSAKLDPNYDPLEALKALSPPESVLAFFRQALSILPSQRLQSATDFREQLLEQLKLVGSASPLAMDERRTTEEKAFSGDQKAVERWLEREKGRIAGPKKGPKNWDI